MKENAKRLACKYKIGDKVLLDYKNRKMNAPYMGPYYILMMNKNGTFVIQKERTELTVNVRQLPPF